MYGPFVLSTTTPLTFQCHRVYKVATPVSKVTVVYLCKAAAYLYIKSLRLYVITLGDNRITRFVYIQEHRHYVLFTMLSQ